MDFPTSTISVESGVGEHSWNGCDLARPTALLSVPFCDVESWRCEYFGKCVKCEGRGGASGGDFLGVGVVGCSVFTKAKLAHSGVEVGNDIDDRGDKVLWMVCNEWDEKVVRKCDVRTNHMFGVCRECSQGETGWWHGETRETRTKSRVESVSPCNAPVVVASVRGRDNVCMDGGGVNGVDDLVELTLEWCLWLCMVLSHGPCSHDLRTLTMCGGSPLLIRHSGWGGSTNCRTIESNADTTSMYTKARDECVCAACCASCDAIICGKQVPPPCAKQN
eukprot:344179-Amphidinium_carterae.3